MNEIFLIGIVVGYILGPIIISLIEQCELWYRNKYAKYTPGDGRNYCQILRRVIDLNG